MLRFLKEEHLKTVLETIPVYDALDNNDECFLCSLMEEAEKDAISYYLSSAIMAPEVRVTTNRDGFCPHHLSLLAEENKAQSLGLMMDTYHEENDGTLFPILAEIEASSRTRKAEKLIRKLDEAVREREAGCLICSCMEDRLLRYEDTVLTLFNQDEDFVNVLSESKGLCLHHSMHLLRRADLILSGDRALDFYRLMASLMKKNLERVREDE